MSEKTGPSTSPPGSSCACPRAPSLGTTPDRPLALLGHDGGRHLAAVHKPILSRRLWTSARPPAPALTAGGQGVWAHLETHVGQHGGAAAGLGEADGRRHLTQERRQGVPAGENPAGEAPFVEPRRVLGRNGGVGPPTGGHEVADPGPAQGAPGVQRGQRVTGIRGAQPGLEPVVANQWVLGTWGGAVGSPSARWRQSTVRP